MDATPQYAAPSVEVLGGFAELTLGDKKNDAFDLNGGAAQSPGYIPNNFPSNLLPPL